MVVRKVRTCAMVSDGCQKSENMKVYTSRFYHGTSDPGF